MTHTHHEQPGPKHSGPGHSPREHARHEQSGHGHSGHEHAPAGHSHDDPASESEGADLLDLDGEVLAAHWGRALDRVMAAATPALATARESGAPVRVVDLGAGTGTGALGLASRLEGAGIAAEVVAVDVSEPSLERIAAKAQAAGLGDRVRTVVADLDDGWPDLAPVDLTWASMSLHHLADPVRSLSELGRITSPGGLLAVSEFVEPVRFLPEDLGIGRPGFEDRALAVLGAAHAEALPHLGASWSSLLAEAGWTVVDEHDVVIDERSPEHPLAGAYARAWFSRLAHGLDGRLDAEDERTLAALLDDSGPHGVLRRADLHLRGTRTLTVARA